MKRPLEQSPAMDSGENILEADTSAQQGIQRLIHFVWAGGDDNMPLPSIQAVKQWAAANSTFDVMIWIDAREKLNKQIDSAKLAGIFRYYQEMFNPTGIDVFLNNVPSDYQRKNKAPIIIRDITEYKMVNEYVRYEIDKVVPNYGASSDMLRYQILHNYGGVYIDSDVRPGLHPLTTCPLFLESLSDHILYLDHVSQKVNPPAICFEVFELLYPIALDERGIKTYSPIPGNDSFICTRGNPLMLEIIQYTENNYQLPIRDEMDKCIISAYGEVDWKTQTIHRTGTKPVQEVLSTSKSRNYNGEYYEITCSNQKVIVLPLRHTGSMLTQPVKNTKNWISAIDWNRLALKLVLPQLVEQTRQELKFFGVLRLNDHIHFIREFATKKRLNPELFITDYFEQLSEKKLPLNEIKVAQLISFDPRVNEFYTTHNLFQSTQIIKGSSPELFNQVCDLTTSKTLFNKIIQDLKDHGPLVIKNMDHTEGEIQMMYRAFNVAIEFIEMLQSNPNRFERMLADDCTTCLQNILTLAVHFEEKFASQDLQFNSERADQLLIKFKQNKAKNDMDDAKQLLEVYTKADYNDEDQPENDKEKRSGSGHNP